MQTETIQYKGYTVTIAQDEHAENPFTNFDCEPPLLVYSERLDTYNDAPDCLADFVRLLPETKFARGERLHILKAFKPEKYGWREWLKDVARKRADNTYYRAHSYPLRDALGELLTEEHGSKPEGWRSAGEWFDLAASLLTMAGIPFHSTESHGYCQGDTVKLLAIALPEWVELVGAPADSLPRQCEAACDLYGSWAWGDVYGIREITDPDGDELDDGSVWGFYGRDHEKSGLMESARDTIEAHIAERGRVRTIARNMCLA